MKYLLQILLYIIHCYYYIYIQNILVMKNNLPQLTIKNKRITTLRSYMNFVLALPQIELLNQKIKDNLINQNHFMDQLIYHFQIINVEVSVKIRKTYHDFVMFDIAASKIFKTSEIIPPKLPKENFKKISFQIPQYCFKYLEQLNKYLSDYLLLLKKNPISQLIPLFFKFIGCLHWLSSQTYSKKESVQIDVLRIQDEKVVQLELDKKYISFQGKKYLYSDYQHDIRVQFTYQFQMNFFGKNTIFYHIKIHLKEIVLQFKIMDNCMLFITILDHIHKAKYYQRYQSSYKLHNNCDAQFLIDGAQHFKEVFNAISNAKQTIYITDWFFSPQVILIRPVAKNADLSITPETSLKGLLQKKSIEGVKIYIIIWKNPPISYNNYKHVLKTMKNLKGGNIKVIASPHQGAFFLMSHHQKILIVDQTIGFVGGIDLAFCRFDYDSHHLFDYLQNVEQGYQNFPGMDYYNGFKQGFENLHDSNNISNWRQKNLSRLPWHDTSVKLTGPIVYDLSKQFINYFNVNICPQCYQKNQQCHDSLLKNLLSLPASLTQFIKKAKGQTVDYQIKCFQQKIPDISHLKDIPVLKEYKQNKTGTLQCQLVRSASKWSHKIQGKQCSIQNAYLELIQKSKHYIYIENQFFISSASGSKQIYNRVVKKLISRIIKAAKLKQKFRVYIIIPVMPEYCADDFQEIPHQFFENIFNFISASTDNIMQETIYWQNQTIQYSHNSIYRTLIEQNIKLEQYIQILSLRNHGINPYTKLPETQIIYVHSKLMIVDDQYAIIGSANINDRSMNGDRDSELNVVIQDTQKIQTLMNGKNILASKKIHELRKRIFDQHFGSDSLSLADPIVDASWQQIRKNAENNTAIYEQIFNCFPSNKIRSFAALEQYKQLPKALDKYEEKVKALKGRIVEYPRLFLCNDREKMRTLFLQLLAIDLIT